MSYGLGLVIGKFYPPHRGHKLLIDTAVNQCHDVVVIVCGKKEEIISGEIRGQWLQKIHPSTRVMVIDDQYDPDDSQVWADNTILWLGRSPDAVFTSEDYGDRYAALMGSRHVQVDRQRGQVPISATAIRNDPYQNWDFLEPPVKSWYAKRVCILGAESTGTTTIAQSLSTSLRTVWVEEYGREYSAIKWDAQDYTWQSEEFIHIAKEQIRRENEAAHRANRVLICDTNAFATNLWHRRYMGAMNPLVENIARECPCHLYLLTGDEIPFIQDGLRDGEHLRHEMHQWFESALSVQNTPWYLLRGSREKRLDEALTHIQSLFVGSLWNPCGIKQFFTL